MSLLGRSPTEAELEDIINEYDTDRNGQMEFTEFCSLMAPKMNADTDEELEEAFDVFDRDGNGALSASELKIVFKNLGENIENEEVNEMIRVAFNGREGDDA